MFEFVVTKLLRTVQGYLSDAAQVFDKVAISSASRPRRVPAASKKNAR
jgi:hypothetical protein